MTTCDGIDPTTGERVAGRPRLLYPHEDGQLYWGVVEEFGTLRNRVVERVVLWWPIIMPDGTLIRRMRTRAG